MSGAVGRTRADLEGAVGAARDDGDDLLPHAGTAVLVRDGADGVEVLILRRPDRGSFGGAWVFPGGRVEDVDRWVGADAAADARRAAARETAEEVGLHVDARTLVPVSRWTPPPGVRTRIRTWFFVGAGTDAALHASAAETTSVGWHRPEDLLAAHAAGRLALYPPTWVTLDRLRGAASAASVLDDARTRPVARFAGVVRRGASGAVFLWEPDAAYPAGVTLDAPGPRHRLDAGALPWVYTRSA